MLGLILFSVVPVVLLVSIILAWLFERRSNRVTDADAKKKIQMAECFLPVGVHSGFGIGGVALCC